MKLSLYLEIIFAITFFVSCSQQDKIISGKTCQKKEDCGDNKICHLNICENICINHVDCSDGFRCDSSSHVCVRGNRDLDVPDGSDNICKETCTSTQTCSNGKCIAIVQDDNDVIEKDDNNTAEKKKLCKDWFVKECDNKDFRCSEKPLFGNTFSPGKTHVLNCDYQKAVSDRSECFADCTQAHAICDENSVGRCVLTSVDGGDKTDDDTDTVNHDDQDCQCTNDTCGQSLCGISCPPCNQQCQANDCQNNLTATYSCVGKGWYPCSVDTDGCRYVNSTLPLNYSNGKCGAVCGLGDTQGCTGGTQCPQTDSTCCTQTCSSGSWGTCKNKSPLPSSCNQTCTHCQFKYDCDTCFNGATIDDCVNVCNNGKWSCQLQCTNMIVGCNIPC